MDTPPRPAAAAPEGAAGLDDVPVAAQIGAAERRLLAALPLARIMATSIIAEADVPAATALVDRLIALIAEGEPKPTHATVVAALAMLLATMNADRTGPLGASAGRIVPTAGALLALVFDGRLDVALAAREARNAGRMQ